MCNMIKSRNNMYNMSFTSEKELYKLTVPAQGYWRISRWVSVVIILTNKGFAQNYCRQVVSNEEVLTEAAVFWAPDDEAAVCDDLLPPAVKTVTSVKNDNPIFCRVLTTTRLSKHALIGLSDYSFRWKKAFFFLVFTSQMLNKSFNTLFSWHCTHYMAFCIEIEHMCAFTNNSLSCHA